VATLYRRQLSPSAHGQTGLADFNSGHRTQKSRHGDWAHRGEDLRMVESRAGKPTTTAGFWSIALRHRRIRNSAGTSCGRRAGATVQSESMEV
jgi:hypothetical protein